MSAMEPNHICKNKNCTKGPGHTRKHYYACDYCDRIASWRSVACSYSCFLEYEQQVQEARSKKLPVDTLPKRTDRNREEVERMMQLPADHILKQVREKP